MNTKKKIINIFTNNTEVSLETQAELTKKLIDKGYTVTGEYSPEAELIICIGGDGSLLETVHSCDFPDCPLIGINTGHLGFFQEISVFLLQKLRKQQQIKTFWLWNCLLSN